EDDLIHRAAGGGEGQAGGLDPAADVVRARGVELVQHPVTVDDQDHVRGMGLAGRGGTRGDGVVVLVDEHLDRVAVQVHVLPLGDVADLRTSTVVGVVVPPQLAVVDVRVGDRLRELVGGDGGEGVHRRQVGGEMAAGGGARVREHGIADAR